MVDHTTDPGTLGRRKWLLTVRKQYSAELASLVRNRAFWSFVALFVVCAAYLVVSGHGVLLVEQLGGPVPIYVLLALLSIPIVAGARPLPVAPADTPRGRPRRLWLQVAALLVVIVLTGQRGAAFNRALPPELANIPLWTPFVNALTALWGHAFKNAFWGVNPTLYVLIPGALLLALGARPAEFGFARGYRAWVIALLWSLPYLLPIVFVLAAGIVALPTVLMLALSNLLQNGFSEEFLFRGALLTRLLPLVGASWAAVLSSVLFGLWHIGVNTHLLAGNYLAGAAYGIVSQATFGLALAFVFLRTRNLIAPTIIHLLADIPIG